MRVCAGCNNSAERSRHCTHTSHRSLHLDNGNGGGVADGGQPVGNDQGRATGLELGQRILQHMQA